VSSLSAISRVLVLVASVVGVGCGSPPPLTPPTGEAWRGARAELFGLAAHASGGRARTTRIAMSIREPYTGKTFRSRGAVAVDPDLDALRMIMLGPGGTTAMDLWIREDRFRFEVPALELEKRGDAHTPPQELRGLPVRFLAWWLLRPFGGRLLWTDHDGTTRRFILRDGPAVVDLRVRPDGSVEAERTTWTIEDGRRAIADREWVRASSLGCGVVHYGQESTGVRVTVGCEGIEEASAPNPRAFEDPDAGGAR
jgi:hypothetical protein